MNLEESKTAFVTFYSFKGGVGRSMALINTAGILVGRGFHVLVIDLDLEAPGLSYLNPDATDVSPLERIEPVPPPPQPGFVELLLDAKERGEASDLFTLSVGEFSRRYTRAYPLPKGFGEFADGSLHIMPAGKLDGGYIQRFNTLNLPQLYTEGLGEPLIRFFKTKLVQSNLYDYILVDSRTGFSDEAGICTRDLPDHLMILSGLNHQNVEGTCGFLEKLREQSKIIPPAFSIILSPVPNGEDQLVDKRAEIAKTKFTKAWRDSVEVGLQIPYHPQLALTEEPHIFRRRHGYLTEAYRAIEIRLLQVLGHTADVISRDTLHLIGRKNYRGALRLARRLIRLDGGRPLLDQIAYSVAERDWRAPASLEVHEHSSSRRAFRDIVSDDAGRGLIEFIVEQVSVRSGGWRHAALLRHLREFSPELANRLYLRIIEIAPDDADGLGDYAIFLDQRGESKKAEIYFQRALKSEPEHANNVGNYAFFLDQQGRSSEAEIYFKQALKISPEKINILNNYGQFLIGIDQLEASVKPLDKAFEGCGNSDLDDQAEIVFSLWLAKRLQKQDSVDWERAFKFLIQEDFVREASDLTRILAQAAKILDPVEYEYTVALSQAFLDASKVLDLDRFDRWRNLEPLDPAELRRQMAIAG